MNETIQIRHSRHGEFAMLLQTLPVEKRPDSALVGFLDAPEDAGWASGCACDGGPRVLQDFAVGCGGVHGCFGGLDAHLADFDDGHLGLGVYVRTWAWMWG